MSPSDATQYFSVLPLLEEMSKQHTSTSSARETGFVFDRESETLTAFGRAEPLRSILTLLGMLSLEIVRTGEQVRVSARSVPTGVHISISLPPSPSVHLTFQSTPAITEKRPTADSLSALSDNLVLFMLAQKIAAMSGMKVWLDQDPLIARLNVYVHDYGMMSRVERETPLVLVIEDVVPIGTLLEYYLSHAGFQTIHAYNGEAGIEQAREHIPDLITLDVWMPSMDGLEVLNILKADPATSSIPVVLITVLPNRLVGYERGASDYLQKPVMREDVVECARRLTRSAPYLQPLYKGTPANAVYLAADIAVTGVESQFPSTVMHSFDLLDASCLAHVAGLDVVPELLLIDVDGAPDKADWLATRLRLLDAFNGVPVVAVVSDEQAADPHRRTVCAYDAILPLSELGDAALRTALQL